MRYHSINRIHQFTFFSGKASRTSSFVNNNSNELRSLYPKATYKLWTEREVRGVLARFFPKVILVVYDNLVPEVYKKDLAKYALLYVYGGLYVDLDVRCLKPFYISIDKDIAAFRNPAFSAPSWTVLDGGFLWGVPRRQEFLEAINMIIANFNKNYYGVQPSYPTGGVVLGRAFLKVMSSPENMEIIDNQYVGRIRFATPDHGVTNMSYISQDGVVVAFKNKDHEAEVNSLYINDYKEFWKKRRIYKNNDQESDTLSLVHSQVLVLNELKPILCFFDLYSRVSSFFFRKFIQKFVSFVWSK